MLTGGRQRIFRGQQNVFGRRRAGIFSDRAVFSDERHLSSSWPHGTFGGLNGSFEVAGTLTCTVQAGGAETHLRAAV